MVDMDMDMDRDAEVDQTTYINEENDDSDSAIEMGSYRSVDACCFCPA